MTEDQRILLSVLLVLTVRSVGVVNVGRPIMPTGAKIPKEKIKIPNAKNQECKYAEKNYLEKNQKKRSTHKAVGKH